MNLGQSSAGLQKKPRIYNFVVGKERNPLVAELPNLKEEPVAVTNTDISFLNKEFSQLQAEIERVADNTEWNGMSILNGDAGTTAGTGDTVTFHAGANAGQSVTASFGDFETFFDTNTVAASDVTTSADTFTITGHGYHTSDSVIYANGGGTDATGLTGGTTYFVIKVDANTFKLASSEDNANEGTEITLTGAGNDAQTITRVGVYGLSLIHI